MATFAGMFVSVADAPVVLTPATVTATAEQVPGTNKIVALSATQDVFITWGASGAVVTPSASVGFRLPANNVLMWDTGIASPNFKVFNSSGSTATVTWCTFSKF